MKKSSSKKNDNMSFLSHYDDQYNQIIDNNDVFESSDSETTDLINFRVINTNNSYPSQDPNIYESNSEDNK